MIWPGTGDPYKRKKAIRFLLISAAIGGIAVLLTTLVVNPGIANKHIWHVLMIWIRIGKYHLHLK